MVFDMANFVLYDKNHEKSVRLFVMDRKIYFSVMVFNTFLFQFENKLLPFKTHDAGQQVLTEKEFMDAIDQFVPLSNEKLRKKLYWESETAVRFDGLRDVVPISRLARILDLYTKMYIQF
jgi:hypothetical protein